MNEDAFARRFYADRSELESLRIQLTVERPADGAAEQENYSLRPENFHLPAIAFTDKELAALQTALRLLDGEFAYAEPLRLALQQITWGRPSPLRAPEQRSVALGITGSAGGHELSARLAKVETAIFRNKTILFDYYTMERDEVGAAQGRPLPPALPGRAVLPAGLLARARRDPRLPPLADPRQGLLRDEGRARLQAARPTSTRAPTPTAPTGSSASEPGEAEMLISERIAWQVERHFGRYGEIERRPTGGATSCFDTDYSSAAPDRLLGARPRRARAPRRGRRELVRRDRRARRRCCGEPPRRRRSEPRRRRVAARGDAAGASRAPRTPSAARRGGRDPPRALRAPGDAREHPDRGRPRRRAPAGRRGAASACRSPTRSCARTSTCSTSSTSAAAPTCSTPRSHERRRRSRSTPSPTPTTSPARRGCCPSRPRRSSPRST